MDRKGWFLLLIGFFVLLFIIVSVWYFIEAIRESKKEPEPGRTERGKIVEIAPKGEYGTILIERDVYKAYVTIDQYTIITDRQNIKGLSFKDLQVDMQVEVAVPEFIIEIYPYQYTTERVIILE